MPKYYEIYDMLSGIAQEIGLGKIIAGGRRQEGAGGDAVKHLRPEAALLSRP